MWRGAFEVPDLGFPKGSNILDAGCGNGKTSAVLIDLGFSVIGIDYSENAISLCKKHFENKASFIVSDCWHIPLSNGCIDGIYAIHLTEHLNDDELEKFSDECYRILKSKGKIFVRSFSPDDMRSGNEIRNNISYRYRSPENISSHFKNFEIDELTLVNDKTRFGTIRSRSECIFIKP